MYCGVLYCAALCLSALEFAFARAVPGIHLTGRDYAEQDPRQEIKERAVLPRDEPEVAPKVMIISMVFSGKDFLIR